MKQYIELGLKILVEGNTRSDRTLTGTRSLFGPQFEFDLQAGFPLLTTKRVFTRGIIHELLWFLNGDTNNEFLAQHDVHIWDDWALSEDLTIPKLYQLWDRAALLATKLEITVQEASDLLSQKDKDHPDGFPHGGLAYLDENEIPKDFNQLIMPKGSLGPIYGKQWINWMKPDGSTVNQIQELIDGLKNKPFSRRHIVNTWNVSDLPDESISPQDNVKIGKMALAPCHCLFQFYVREINQTEQFEAGRSRISDEEIISLSDEEIYALAMSRSSKYKLDCKLYQRSADYALGVPFNIASYALFTMMVAQCVGMLPGKFIHTFGDCHLYSNHIEKFEGQMIRSLRELPTMWINPEIKDIFAFTIDDFKLEGYSPDSKIDYEISV